MEEALWVFGTLRELADLQGITRAPVIATCIGPLMCRPFGPKNAALAVPLNVLPLTVTAKEISPRDANWWVFRSAVISTIFPVYSSPTVRHAPIRLLSLLLGSPASGLDCSTVPSE